MAGNENEITGTTALAAVADLNPEALRRMWVEIFTNLAATHPEVAYRVHEDVQKIVKDAPYPRIEIVEVPFDDSPEDTYTVIRFRGKEYGEGDLAAVDLAQRWTYGPSLNPDEKLARFDPTDGPGWEGHVYLLDDTIPVRLPEGWSELS